MKHVFVRFTGLIWLALIIFGSPPYLYAQSVVGIPMISRYPSSTYRADNQNWVAAQDSLGIMYFGNSSGILTYNARQWELIPTPKKTAVRGLAKGQDGRIYVGGQSEFGYLGPDSTGRLNYVSLTSKLSKKQKDFSDIWITLADSKGVYFMASERLFRYDYESHIINTWEPKTNFYYIYRWNSRLYVQEPKAGLFVMQDDSLVLVNDSKTAQKATINNILPYSKKEGLVITGNSGFFLFDGKKFQPFDRPADKEIRTDHPYIALRLPDSTYMIGTLADGLFEIDHNGYILDHYNKTNGLQDNVILNLFLDREQNIWVEHENGISKIRWNSGISYFPESVYGYKGPVLDINRFQNTFYVGTGLGLYKITRNKKSVTTNSYSFNPVKEAAGHQVWRLLPTKNYLIVATGRGTFSLNREGRFKQLIPDESFDLYRPSAKSDSIFVGLEKGVIILKKTNNGWKKRSKIPGLDAEIRSLYLKKDGSLWLGTDYRGIFRVKKEGAKWQISNYGAANGLPEGALRLYKIAGQMVVGSENGFYSASKDDSNRIVFKKFNPFVNAVGNPSNDIQDFRTDDAGNGWLISKDSVSYLKNLNGKLSYAATPYQRFKNYEIEAVYTQDSSTVWLGDNSSLIRYDISSASTISDNFNALITEVKTPNGKTLYTTYSGHDDGRHIDIADLGMYPSSHGSFRFDFTSETFRNEQNTVYRYILKDFNKKWSAWTGDTYKEYSNLPAGNYVFTVEAKNTLGIVSKPASIAFEVMIPWYISKWAILAYLILLVGISYGTGKARVYYFQRRNSMLEELVEDRTRKIKDQNDELLQTNQSLSDLNRLKSEFLNMASHDLKNPLIGIEGMSRIMLEDMEAGNKPADELMKDTLEIFRLIHDSARYMGDILSNLLESTAIESGTISIVVKETDLVPIVQTVVNELKESARIKHINLNLVSTPDAIAMIDPNRTRQILENIIGNAVKYSASNTNIEIEVKNTTTRLPKGVQVVVKDHGPGFTKEDLTKIFGKFQRLSARPSEGEKSTGLGLYISKSLVDLQNGEIWVETEVGKGATFYIELPGV